MCEVYSAELADCCGELCGRVTHSREVPKILCSRCNWRELYILHCKESSYCCCFCSLLALKSFGKSILDADPWYTWRCWRQL